MGKKRNKDISSAMKALSLYSLFLFSGKRYSLTELAEKFECSKPTIMRLIEQIERNPHLHVQILTEKVNRRRYYWTMRPDQKPNVSLETQAIQDLALCRDLLANLLPPRLRDDIANTIHHTTVLLDDFEQRGSALDSIALAACKGAVDYAAHEDTIATILRALRDRRIVKVAYQAHDRPEPRTMAVAPLQLVTHRDTLYLRARREKDLGKTNGFYDPTLAIQRIQHATPTDRTYTPPKPSKDDAYSVFGFMPGKRFTVTIEAEPRVVPYLKERIWSHDQEFTDLDDGRLRLKFSASSEEEVVSWVLGFAGQVVLLAPQGLRERIGGCGEEIGEAHASEEESKTQLHGQS